MSTAMTTGLPTGSVPTRDISYQQNGTNATSTPVTAGPDYYKYVSGEIIKYGLPIILIVGLTGNFLCVLVMSRKKLRAKPVSVYLITLAFADSAVLILDFLNNWFKSVLNITFLTHSHEFCVFHRYFFNVCYTYAGWLIVAVTIDRFITVYFTIKAKTWCTVRRALVAVGILLIVACIVYVNNIWGWHIKDNKCDIHPDQNHYLSFISPWVSGALYSYIPVLLLIIFNVAIIVRLVKQRKYVGDEKSSISREARRITVMVIVICITYMVLTIPVTAFYLLVFSAGLFHTMGPELSLIEAIVQILGLCNHSINFFLYCVMANIFRSELRAMCLCEVDKKGAATMGATKNTSVSSQDGSTKATTNF